MNCLKETFAQGDSIIVPIEYEQGALPNIANFNDFDKIEITLKSDTSDVFAFGTDKTDDYNIAIIDDNNMELIVKSEDTLKMLGEVTADVKYYFTYKTKPMISSEVNIATNIIIAQR